MRVLFYLFFPGGGIGHYTHELLARLHDGRAVRAELACVPSYRWREHASYPVWDGLREVIHPARWRQRGRFLLGQFINPLRLCRRIQQSEPSIVHFSNVNPLSFPLWWPAFSATGAKMVVSVHDVQRGVGIVNLKYENRQLRRIYQRADACFVHSDSQAAELRRFAGIPPEKVHVVPHGPFDYGTPGTNRDAVRNRYGLARGGQVALCFGQVRDEKNLDLLLRAFRARQSSFQLVVAGTSAGRGHKPIAYYRQLAEDLGIARQVVFLDRHLPEAEVADLFHACDWTVLPYSRRFTSQSGVLNLAAWYDRPVLATTAPTLAETLSACDLGITVLADDLQALTEGIGDIQARVARGHSHEFQRYRRVFSWEENAARTADVYGQLLSAPGREVPCLACGPLTRE